MSRPPRLTAAQSARPRAPRTKPVAQTESELLRQVLSWLTLKGVFHWRAGAAAAGSGRGGRVVWGATNPAGTPDVLCVFPWPTREGAPDVGRLVAVELKAKGGRLRPAQRAWMQRAEAVGVLCLVIRSLDELIEAFEREGLP